MYHYRLITKIYELDRFTHINNTNYLRYLEEAREQIFIKNFISKNEMKSAGIIFEIYKIDAFFKKQVLSSEEIEVISTPIESLKSKGVLKQEIRRTIDNSLCFESNVYWKITSSSDLKNSFVLKFINLFKPRDKTICDSFKKINFPTKGKNKRKADKLKIQVRPYEIDSTGKVNSSIYSNYFEFGRWKFLEKVSSLSEIMEKDGIGLILYRSTIEFLDTAKMFDELILYTKVSDLNLLRMIFSHELYLGKTLVARGRAELCCISPTGRPVKIPSQVYDFLLRAIPN